MRAADALDQRRLAGAVVAEQREHLAAPNVEVDAVERGDGAEALRRAADRERRSGGAHRNLAACGDAEALLDVAAEDVGLDRDQDHHADHHQLVEGVDRVQVERVADHADRERADERIADMAAPARERRAADDHRRDRVELGEVAERRRAGVRLARGDEPADRGHQAAQDVDGRPAPS